MPKTKSQAGAKEAPAFDPSKLSKEERDAVVEYTIGVHPKYLIYEGLAARVDIYLMNYDGVSWNGWKGHPLW